MNKEENKIAAFSVGGGLKIGNANSKGVYVGDKLVAGNQFDISQLWNNLSYIFQAEVHSNNNVVLVANLSTNDITFSLQGSPRIIAPKSIDYYNVGPRGHTFGHAVSNGNKPVNAIIYTATSKDTTDIIIMRNIGADKEIASFGNVNINTFARVIILFDN